jgi:nucleoside-triphosphatase THEP1
MNHHHKPVQAAGNSVILVTGSKHCGKTTLVADFIASLSGRGLRIAGILARGLWRDNLRAGFDLVDLSDGSIRPLARRRHHPDPHHHLMFDFLDAGMQAGAQALDPGRCRRADMVVVDEVGKLEARGDGWAPHIHALLAINPPLFILIVRLDCIQRICDRFGFHDVPVIDARQPHAIGHLRSAAEGVLVPRRKYDFFTRHQE